MFLDSLIDYNINHLDLLDYLEISKNRLRFIQWYFLYIYIHLSTFKNLKFKICPCKFTIALSLKKSYLYPYSYLVSFLIPDTKLSLLKKKFFSIVITSILTLPLQISLKFFPFMLLSLLNCCLPQILKILSYVSLFPFHV